MPSMPVARSVAVPVLMQMLVCSFLWASAFLLIKLVAVDLSPLALTALRGMMGGIVLALWLLARGEGLVPRGSEWRDWLVLGVFQGIIPNTLTAFALTQIAAGLSSMIQASSPLMVAVLAHVLFADERLTPRRTLGVAVGLAGMILLLGPAAFEDGSSRFPGVAAMVATAMSYAAGNLYVRTIGVARPARLAFGQQILSGLPAFVIVLVLSGPESFAAVPDHAAALFMLGVFGTALPIVLFMNILRLAGPTLGSMNGYLVPVWAVLLGAVLLGEAVAVRELAAGAAVLVGIAIVTSSRRRPETALVRDPVRPGAS